MIEKRPALSQFVCFSFYCPDSKREMALGIIHAHDAITNPELESYHARNQAGEVVSTGTIFEGFCDMNTYLQLKKVLNTYAFNNPQDQKSNAVPVSEMERVF